MIDLHAHILPGLDDGARDLDEAMAMARQAAAEGITGVFATPHVTDPAVSHREIILAALEELGARLAAEGVPVRLYPGAEVFLTPSLPALVEAGAVLTLNDGGRYLLVEAPMLDAPPYLEPVVFDLLTMGVTPILAHPERNPILAGEPRRVATLVERGCLMQINAGSLRGRFGQMAKRTAERFISDGLAHFAASDAHRADQRRLALADARGTVRALRGEAFAEEMFSVRPRQVLAGGPIRVERAAVEPERRRGLVRFIMGMVRK